MGRSLKPLIVIISALAERDVGCKSRFEQIDTTTSGGKLVFHVFGALAEFERDLVRARTRAGLRATRPRPPQGLGGSQEAGAGPVPLRRKTDQRRHDLLDRVVATALRLVGLGA